MPLDSITNTISLRFRSPFRLFPPPAAPPPTPTPSLLPQHPNRRTTTTTTTSAAFIPSPRRTAVTPSATDATKTTARNAGAYDFDLFVIGGGSGGVRGSRFAAGFGAKVALCEMPFAVVPNPENTNEGGMGGTCVLRGCVPKKIMMYGSQYPETIRDAQGFGWQTDQSTPPPLDWSSFRDRKNAELSRLNNIYGNILKNNAVESVVGKGAITGPHGVAVTAPDGSVSHYTAKYILIATGGRPYAPGIPGKEVCF